jgi:hypothetical protein
MKIYFQARILHLLNDPVIIEKKIKLKINWNLLFIKNFFLTIQISCISKNRFSTIFWLNGQLILVINCTNPNLKMKSHIPTSIKYLSTSYRQRYKRKYAENTFFTLYTVRWLLYYPKIDKFLTFPNSFSNSKHFRSHG